MELPLSAGLLVGEIGRVAVPDDVEPGLVGTGGAIVRLGGAGVLDGGVEPGGVVDDGGVELGGVEVGGVEVGGVEVGGVELGGVELGGVVGFGDVGVRGEVVTVPLGL